MRRLSLLPLALLGCGTTPAATDAGSDLGGSGDAADATTPADAGHCPKRTVDPSVARWVLPRAADGTCHEPFALPWPNDLARDAAGKLDLSFFPNDGVHPLVRQYLQSFDHRLAGFSPAAAVYLTFGAALDPATLPADASASRGAESPLQLIDVDPASPERGRRIPLQWFFRDEATRYWPSHALAVAPAWGFPMRGGTHYALVALSTLRAADGTAFHRDADLEAVLSTAASIDPAVLAARTLYAPALGDLERAGIARDRILSVTTFTTDDPTADFFRAADWIDAHGAVPALLDMTSPSPTSQFIQLTGHYGPNLVFQSGDNPYNAQGSGDFVLGADGVPVQQGTENIHFALTLPTTPMPAGGYPVAIYAHGTGGNYLSFVHDGTAAALAAEGVATLGFDQIFHGQRAVAGTSPESAFFNFVNPSAGRTNNRQAGLDLVQSGRFVRRLSFPMAGAGGTTTTVRFDPRHVMFFGHSQGGLNGPLWLAANDGAGAAVLSGAAGSIMVSLLQKTQPVNIPALVTAALGLDMSEFVSLHPVVTLLQTLVDPSDPQHYARFIVREPRPSTQPAHVFQTQGFVDHYAPPDGIEALAVAIGLPLTSPVLHPQPSYDLTGAPVATLPLRANVAAASGHVTGSWMQFNSAAGSDGHFVVFDIPGARLRAAAFLGSAGRDPDGVPTVPATFEGADGGTPLDASTRDAAAVDATGTVD